ncbi:ATP-binding cassette domain-containing protein [Paenibacillus eucommiae]|uniref:ABC-type multidrug transport system fused ATPase/permease subunit n=1 Tax=Paenibacillus eucommiae TaxID=1355755 RepID=A0ABS4IUW9_9BACL|nr:ABC transporter ATP-binding protein [Paenibacillus eucommiae]MBP1990880.1 ABC-type multidrug transport system fused ATPase/permease subunit [Paenibacillus eucommiae]
MKKNNYFTCFQDAFSILYRVDKRPVIILAVALLASVPVMPAELWLVKSLIDRIQVWTATDPVGQILVVAAWLGVIMLVSNIALGVQIPLAMTRLMELGTLEEQRMLLKKTSLLPIAAVESPEMKDLRERALQISLYDIYSTGVQVLQMSLQLGILIAVMLIFGQWIPVTAVMLAAVLLSVVSSKTSKSLENLARIQTPDRRLLRHYAELMTERNGAKEIRLFGLGRLLTERWTRILEQQSSETTKAVRSSELRKIGPELLMALIGGLLLALVVLMPGANKLTAGDFALLFMALTMLLSQLPDLIGQIVAMRKQYMKWEDFRAYLDLEEENLTRADSLNSEESLDSLQLQVSELSFRYPGASRDTLSGVSFTIPPGCRAALVGENGSGKSTLIKLLLGLYPPNEGEIIWRGSKNGQVTKAMATDGPISVVFQDFTRLYLNLRENVALGKLTAIGQDALLQSSLQSAGSSFSDLNIQFGAPFGGIEPSGGEWQKIATARAMLRDANFVFFDEPTAALDPQAEKEAFELFLRVTKGRSALLVTHRLGAAKLADLIIVMKDGRLVEQGTHDELMQRSGPYSHMFNLQASWYL